MNKESETKLPTEKSTIKNDRRVYRTQKSIRDALISLIEEKDLTQITIKELAERANINRKTFYMHYNCIGDVLDTIENELINKLLVVLESYDFFDSRFEAYALFCSLNDVIHEDFDLIHRLIHAHTYSTLLVKVKKILKDALLERYTDELSISREEFSLYGEFAASGIISMYVEWFGTHSDITLEELAKAAGKITFYGIYPILNNGK